MSNGFGAGFAALAIIAVLVGLALLLGLLGVGAVLLQRRSGRVPDLLRYLVLVVLAGVVVVGGFGVVAFVDEALTAAVLLLALVFIPLTLVGVYLWQTTDLSRVDVFTVSAVAWSLPFLVGIGVAAGIAIGIGTLGGSAPADFQRVGGPWITTAVSGLIIILGAILLGNRVSPLMTK